MKVVAYIRVSTDKQGNSMDMQLDKIVKFISYKQFELIQTFSDEDVSAMRSIKKRPAGGKMIAYLQDNKEIKGIVITNLTRAFRNLVDAVQTAEWARRNGFSIHLIDDGMEVDTATPNGFLQFVVQAAIAQWERMTISKRTSDIQQNKKGKNEIYCSGRYGFKHVDRVLDKDGKVVVAGREEVDEYEMENVNKMLGYRERGWSYSKIARQLNLMSVPTKRGKQKWTHTQVISVLKTHNLI